MLKKLLILPILGLVGLTSMSYAGYVCDYDNEPTEYDFIVESISYNNTSATYGNTTYNFVNYQFSDSDYDTLARSCPKQNANGCYLFIAGFEPNTYTLGYGNSNNNVSIVNGVSSTFKSQMSYLQGTTQPSFLKPNSDEVVGGKLYVSHSPFTCTWVDDSSSSDDESGYIPTIPSSFTSGLTSLLSNFGSTIVNWLPTIILVALGIYGIFALFRVVRNYARSSFRG